MNAAAISPAEPAFASRPLRDYARWVTGGANADGSAVCVIERPPAGGDVVCDAHRAGADRLVCGFLPDEVLENWLGAMPEVSSVLDCWEFRPYRLPAVPAACDSRVVYLSDSAGEDGAFHQPGGCFADVLARVMGHSAVRVDVRSTSDVRIAELVASAPLVVNDVNDWSMGFAIDEWAARAGRRVFRMRNPGYSPLRYGLLGQALPPERGSAILPLRPVLQEVLRAGPLPSPAAEIDAWFSPAIGGERWRRLMNGRSIARFWSGLNRRQVEGLVDSPCNAWLDKPVAWGALAAATDPAEFPADALARVLNIVTTWLIGGQKGTRCGTVCENALRRWVRVRPQWIEMYRERASGRQNVNADIVRWMVGGLRWRESSEPIQSMLDVAQRFVEGDPPGVDDLRHALYWAGIPTRPPAAAPVDSTVRSVCAEICWQRLQTGSLLPLELIDKESIWRESLGGAAPGLRTMAALGTRNWTVARKAWRDQLAMIQVPPCHGLRRLFRRAFLHPKDAAALVRSAAEAGPGQTARVIAEFAGAWLSRCAWPMWRWTRPADVAAELSTMLVVLDAELSHSGWKTVQGKVVALVYALADREDAVRSVIAGIEEAGAAGEVVNQAALGAALACAFRGHTKAAAELTAAHPALPREPAMPTFLRGVIAQLTGEVVTAGALASRLLGFRPALFDWGDPTGSHWAFAAAMMKRAGQESAAMRLRETLKHTLPASLAFIDDVPCGCDELADGWREVLFPREQSAPACEP